MLRRDFFKAATASAAVGYSAEPVASVQGEAAVPTALSPDKGPIRILRSLTPDLEPARIMRSPTEDDQRQRLQNVAACERGIRKCVRKHLITRYIPGQAAYNLGEYPCFKPYDPDEYDERELDRLRDGGIRLVQVMEEWNDLLRLFGGDKFKATNPAGLRRFIDMVHKRGMKILIYASSGYMQAGDPDLRDDWVRGYPGKVVQAAHWRLVRCSPASPGWRAYLLPRTLRILEEFGPDGLYNDWGYRPLYNNPYPPTKDEVLAFQESANHDAALEDLLSLIHSEVKRRGGIYKIHADNDNRPRTNAQLYDYLWVGEGVERIDKVREDTKNYPPYVVPRYDFRNGKPRNEDEIYLNTIPYMQFPLLLAGRPFTGERATIPGVAYLPEKQDPLLRQWRAMWKYCQTHPKGPFVFGPWDSFPIWPDVRVRHSRWLKQYLPLVEEGTRAYIEISESDLFSSALPPKVVASAFANLETYLVLANYSTMETRITTSHDYVPIAEPLASPHSDWKLSARSFLILRRVPSGERSPVGNRAL
jgi:hypothetical protein